MLTDRRRCWCDGIYLPEEEAAYSVEQVLATKQIDTIAWFDEGKIKGGERGQFEYTCTIVLGEKALNHYRKGLDLKKCLPDDDRDDWIWLDREKRELAIELL